MVSIVATCRIQEFVMHIDTPESHGPNSDALAGPITTAEPRAAIIRLRRWKALLAVASIGVSLLTVELAIRIFALRLPLSLSQFLQEDVKILAQTSKRATIPHDYIAILGDSYAAG